MCKYLSVIEAAKILGINGQRVRALIAAPCPRCHGENSECPRCRGSGRRLPAVKLNDSPKSPWMIPAWALKIKDIKTRTPGKPTK